MKIKKIICFLFGHKMDWFAYENAICLCERCGDCRSSYFQDDKDWTSLEFHGILRYPFFKAKIRWKVFYITKVLKLKPFRKIDESDDLPF